MNKKEQPTNSQSQIKTGAFSNSSENFIKPNLDFKINEDKFVKDELGLISPEISFNTMEPNTALHFLDKPKHKEDEKIYLGIKGKGQLLINDNFIDIKEGTIVRVAKNAVKAIRNTAEDLFSFIVIPANQNTKDGSTVSNDYGIEKKPNWNYKGQYVIT